jgi:multicomponent Na+:H+ antiporter subunit C
VNTTNLTLSLLVGVFYAGGAYLLLQWSLLRAILGFVLLGHGANLLLLLAGGRAGAVPVAGEASPSEAADPLAQAMALTAIVITFAVTALLLALARRGIELNGDDEVPVDVADQDLAARERRRR